MQPFPMNTLALLCLVFAVSLVAVAVIALSLAVLLAKDGYQDEDGFHPGSRAGATAQPAKRPVIAPSFRTHAQV